MGDNDKLKDDPWDSPDNYMQSTDPSTGATVLVMKSSTEVFQNDVRDLLIACGIPYYARSESPHEVVWREILPAIRRMRAARLNG